MPETRRWSHSDFIPCSIISHHNRSYSSSSKRQSQGAIFAHAGHVSCCQAKTHLGYLSSSEGCLYFPEILPLWGAVENLCYFWCTITGPAEPVLTRFPCIKILGFRMQTIARWKTVNKEAVLGPVCGLRLYEGRAWGWSAPVLALVQLRSGRKWQTSRLPLPEAHMGLSPLCTSFRFEQFLGNSQVSHLFWEDLFLRTKA